eukprot:675549-Rhodomonas_salina.2
MPGADVARAALALGCPVLTARMLLQWWVRRLEESYRMMVSSCYAMPGTDVADAPAGVLARHALSAPGTAAAPPTRMLCGVRDWDSQRMELPRAMRCPALT